MIVKSARLNGAINAFDPTSGLLLGTLQDGTGIAGPDTVESNGLLGTIQAAPTLTSIGVVNAASFLPAITPGAFTTIFGTSLAATTRVWNSTDFVNGKLPVQLDGVSVTIDGKLAFVYYVSPTQIDVVAPADATAGAVPVVVTNNKVASGAGSVALQATAPAFFAAGKYMIATHADGSLVGPANVLPGATPAKVGETIAIYGTGFGATNPAVDGLVVTSPANTATAPVITIGTNSAASCFQG